MATNLISTIECQIRSRMLLNVGVPQLFLDLHFLLISTYSRPFITNNLVEAGIPNLFLLTVLGNIPRWQKETTMMS